MPKIEAEETYPAACSVDRKEHARALVEKLGLTFDVGYGLNHQEVSEKTGAFHEPNKNYIHAAGFLLNPDNTVAVAVYSTGAIGRFASADFLAMIRYYKKIREAPARSVDGIVILNWGRPLYRLNSCIFFQ